MTDEIDLSDIREKLGDLLTVYKLLHYEEIEAAKERILGEGTRKQVYDLCDGEKTVAAMAKALKVSSPAVSQHLALLVDAGLVGTDNSTGKRLYIRRLDR